jgi:O6-methylguanine-DNA--protein-cysteine methyltransferase
MKNAFLSENPFLSDISGCPVVRAAGDPGGFGVDFQLKKALLDMEGLLLIRR